MKFDMDVCHSSLMKTHKFNPVHSENSTRCLLEVVRLSDSDAIAHVPLRMHITDITQPNLFKSDIRLFVFHN
jgi:hypothetical protein